jgi:Family of unknown function (DUF5519)
VSSSALIDEIANELDSWPGVRIERRSQNTAVVFYEQVELGRLDGEHEVVELHFSIPERDRLVEHGEGESPDPVSDVVSHDVRGPSDVTAVLELFDRRYRDLRGDEDPYSSEDPA